MSTASSITLNSSSTTPSPASTPPPATLSSAAAVEPEEPAAPATPAEPAAPEESAAPEPATSAADAATPSVLTSSSVASKLSESSKASKEQQQANSAANKQKFAALNINNLYKGKSLENPKASVVVRNHGLQTVGKVGASRRGLLSNNASLKASSSAVSLTNSTSTSASSNSAPGLVNSASAVSIVPTGGQGWAASGKDDSDNSVSNSTKPESSTCPSTADSASSPASSTTNDFTASVPAATNVAPVPAAIIPPTTGGISSVKSGLQPGVPLHSSASSERLASLRHPNVGGDRRQADPYFAQEFPQLSATTTAGGNSTQPQSAKDLSNQRQGSRGGHVGVGGQQHLRDRDDPPLPGAAATSHRPIAVGNNQAGNSYNYKDTGPPGAEDDISLLGTSNNSSTLDGPFNANSSSRQSGRNKNTTTSSSVSSNPNFLLPDPPIPSVSTVPTSNPLSNQQQRNNYNSGNQQQFSSSQSSNQYARNSSNPHYRHKQKEKPLPPIVTDQDIKSLDSLLDQDKECSWVLESEIDYTAKLDFSDSSSDEESEEAKKSTTSSTTSSSKPTVIDAAIKKTATAAAAEASEGPKALVAPQLGPTPSLHSERNSAAYVGRKSDTVYENYRKEQEYDGRRDYYRESHRSQQLPRGGGGGRDRDGYWDSGNSSSAYPQGPPMGGPLSGGASHHTSQPHSSTSSSSRTSTLDRNERSHGRGHADPERRGDREEVGGRRGKERDENWRPKGTVNDDLNSAVNRGRTLHGPLDDAAIDGGALTKKPLGPPAVDELILPPPASKSMGPQSKEIRGEDMRPYDRRRDDGGYREASDRRDRGDRERDRGDRYDRGMVKNQYATNLPPRLQRQAEMQYAQGGNRNQGRDRYGDEPRMMRQSDRSDDLYERAGGDQRRGSDRRTPEDAASSNMASRSQANARSEAGSWRISKREDQRRDSGHQIESKVAVPDATSDSVPAGKTSNDSNYVRNVASPATSESGRKSVPETVTTTAVSSASAAQQQSVLNKVSSKSDSPESTSSTQPLAGKEVQLASDRSEPQQQPSSEHHHVSTGEQQQRPKETTAPSRRSAEVERPSRPRSNANEPLGGRNVYEQSSSSSSIRRHQERGNSNRQPQQQQQAPVTVYTGGRDSHRNKQQPQLSHPQQQQPPMLSSHSEAGARSGDYRPDQQRAYSQQQHQQQSGRRDGGYRNAPPVLSQQLHSLEDNRVSPSLTAQSGQKNAQSDAMEPKKTAVDSNQQQRQTPPQAVSQQLTATGQSATANTASAQPAAVPQGQTTAGGGQAAVVLPYPGAPTSVRAVRTAYGPPASKAAFGSSDAVIDKPTQSATPPQGSIGGAPVQQQPLPTVDPKTSAPVLSSQMNQKPVAPVQPQQQQASHLLTRPSDAVSSAGRSTDSRRGRPDSRQPSGLQNQGRVSGEAGGRYGRERPDGRTDRRSGGERDRKLSTGSKTSATGAAASGTSHPLPAQSPNATVHSLNNNQQSLDVDDEWETASDNSHSDFGINHAEGASHATLDRNANITAGPNGGANRRTAASKAVAGSNSDLRSQKSIEQQQQQRTNYREDRTRVQLEQRGGKRGDRRGNDLMEQANYRGGPRGAAYGGPMEGQANYRGERRNDRGGGQPGTDLSRGRTNSYRSMNTPLTSGKGGPQNQQQQQLGPRNQDVLVNAMVKVTLDDPKAANALLDATTGKGGANIKGAPLRKNSSNIAPGGDYLVDDDMYSESEYIDGYGRRSNRQRGRTLSNASNKQQESRRKERPTSKTAYEGTGRRGDGQQQSAPRIDGGRGGQQGPTVPKEVNTVKSPTTQSTDSKQLNKADPRSAVSGNYPNSANANASRLNANKPAGVPNASKATLELKAVATSAAPAPGAASGSAHPSTSSTKSNSFDQHDSGIDSEHQPPSTSSTSTSQRSSPSTEEGKVVVSTANTTSKLTITTNSSSSVKCSTTTTSTANDPKAKKADSLGNMIEDSADAMTSSTGAPTTLKPSAVQHGNSSVAEELKMKFDSPSLKKVWDNPAPASMSSAMEHSTERKNSLLSDKNVSKSSMVSMGSCGLSFFAPPPPLSSRNGHRTSSMSSTTSSHTPGPSPGPILANVHPPYLLAPFPQSHLNPNPSLHALLGAGPNQSMQHAVTMGGQMANSPPILAPELRPAAYPQAHVPAQYGQGIPPQAVGGFHQNVVQTPTSPPTAMPQLYPANNSLAANQAVQQGPFPGPFGQMEQMNAFAAANAAAHQNPMHPMHFMPVQTGAAGQPANVAAFNQNVAMMNAQQAHAQQLFMAQLAHQSQQSQLEQMNKFSMAAAAAQSNVLANNILKPQAFVGGQPNAAAANHQAAAAALHHQGAVNLLQAQAQGTANWATASQAGAQGQQPPPQIAAQLAHFVQAQPGQPQQQQPSAQAFTRQPNPNVPQLNSRNPAIEQAQQQGQNALRSYFQANMLNMDAMQNHHAAQYMNHHHAGHHHPHEASRQQQAAVAAAALQQAASRQAVAPGQFAPNALNQSWANQPAHIQKHMLLQSMSNQRQFMQMFAANAAVAGQPGLGGNVPMGMAGPVGGQAQVVNNHRTSPSASMGGGGGPGGPPANVYQPAPIQRPNNGPNGGAGGPNSKNNGQYSNRNGKFEERRKSGGGGGGGAGGGRSYYGHNRNSATPSPSGKSMVPPEMNGGPPPPPQGNNQSTTAAGTTNSSAVECNVNKD